jgi:hypothetical protein
MRWCFLYSTSSLCQADHVRFNSLVRLSSGKDSKQDRIAVYYGESGRKAGPAASLLERDGKR